MPPINESDTAHNVLGGSAEYLGDGAPFADLILALVGHSQFSADLSREDVATLCSYLKMFRVKEGHVLISEGDIGDFMLFVLEGKADIYKTNSAGELQHMSTVLPGRTVGEMSMIDGEPRFATCVASTDMTCGVFTRADASQIISRDPALSAKFLVRLVTLLSQRFRHTSAMLLRAHKMD
jgi:CRP-like cAMP-binding protein